MRAGGLGLARPRSQEKRTPHTRQNRPPMSSTTVAEKPQHGSVAPPMLFGRTGSRLSSRRKCLSSAMLPAAEVVDVILKDGGTLRLRAPAAADADALIAFFGARSDR